MRKRIYPKTFNCIECKIEKSYRPKQPNKFCGHKCQRLYEWKYITIPKLESGKVPLSLTKSIRRYLIEKYGNKCSACYIPNIWNKKELVFHIDHIDGDSDNNVLMNFRLLCPNCHSQTDTWGSKGCGRKGKKESIRKKCRKRNMAN